MKDRTFKNFIISLCLAYTLILLTGCGGGGGGSTSGGFGYIATNNINTDSTDNISSNNNSSDNNSSDNNSSDKFLKIPISCSYQGETKDVRMKLGQAWKIDVSMEKLTDTVTVNPTFGEGNGEFIKITIPENTTNKTKNITIPVTNSEGTKQIANILITQQSSQKKAWLFVNYFACDNNLANFQLDSLNEMEKVGSDDNTHVIAYFDLGDRSNISKEYKYYNIITKDEWPGGVREFYLMPDNTEKITSPIIKYYENLDTDSGNPVALTDFLLRIIEQYPAEKICINLINHGAAYGGMITDETIEDADSSGPVNLLCLQWSLQKVYEQIGKKVDLLMLDACVMANFETAYQLKDYVSYIISSEEESLVSVLDGLNGSVNYYEFLTDTASSSSSVLSSQIKKIQKGLESSINSPYTKIASDYDGLTLAKAILKANKIRRDQFLINDYQFTNYNTCSIINCSKIDNLKNAIFDFANYVKSANSTDKEVVKKAMENAIIEYAKNSDIMDTYENIKKYYGLVDEEQKDYIVYRPFGEIYSPNYYDTVIRNNTNDIVYICSVSDFFITDLGLIMQKIYNPTKVYDIGVPPEILSSSNELKAKAENVYNKLKEVIPEDCYYGTEKISLIDYNNYGYLPFGYHKYSNGLNIGCFAYNNSDEILNSLEVKSVDSNTNELVYIKFINIFKQLMNSNKNVYKMVQFYSDCPEWIEMQESLY